MTLTPRYRLAPHLLAQFDLEEAILLDELAGRYFAANSVASRILRACRDGASRERILDDLVRDFLVDRERAGADLDRFLSDLVARGMLLVETDSP